MFVVGLVIGPLIGLGIAHLLEGAIPQSARTRFVLGLLLVAVIVFLPVSQLESRVGLAAGVLLGLLLSATPSSIEGAAD